MTPEQLAQMLQVTRSWVTSKTRRSCVNPLPHMRIGKYIRFNRLAVLEWMESTTTPQALRKKR
jgi:excisionase family DNA binding protein